MQIFFRTLLAICLGHLLADFVLQTPRLVAEKRRGRPRGYLVHGLFHYASTIVAVGFFIRGSGHSLLTYLVLLALTFFHVLIDLVKMRLTQREIIPDATISYATDQVLHFVTVVFAAWMLSPGVAFHDLTGLVGAIRNLPATFLAVPVVYIAVVFGGGYLIRYLTRNLSEGLGNLHPERATEQLQNAGLYIGWLERFLVVTALLLQSPATIGLILTAKSIARYPEFKSERFAEYFLIGTLLSISVAMLGGIFLSKLLLGFVHFS